MTGSVATTVNKTPIILNRMHQALLLLSLLLLILLLLIEFLSETRIIIIIIIIIQIIIIGAGTPLVSNSFHFSWNPLDILNFRINTFWFPVKVEGITDERGTSAYYF